MSSSLRSSSSECQTIELDQVTDISETIAFEVKGFLQVKISGGVRDLHWLLYASLKQVMC